MLLQTAMSNAKNTPSLTSSKSKTLSKGQKLFKKMIGQIEKRREELKQWQDVAPKYQQVRQEKMQPIIESMDLLKIAMVKLLDSSYTQKIFTKKDRAKLDEIILELATSLLTREKNPEIQEIFDRHSEIDYAEQELFEQEMAKEMLADMFGVEVEGDVDLRNPQAMLEKMMREMAEMEEQEAAKPRKKTAKQIAKEEQQAQAEKEVSQSLRDVYRKLVAALHPDREQDLAERARKTELMQRVNVAYDNRDLLQLLQLQLELEQIDQDSIAAMSDERLKHYNQVLKEQLQDLEMELHQIEFAFRLKFDLSPDSELYPPILIPQLEQFIARLQITEQTLQQDLHDFTDAKKIKAWLKGYELQEDFDIPF